MIAADRIAYQYPKPLPRRNAGSLKGRIQAALMEEIEALRAHGYMPTTVRFLYYRLVAAGVVEKVIRSHYQAVSTVCTELREAQVVAMHEIVDRSRGITDYSGWSSIAAACRHEAGVATLDRWPDAPTPMLVVESNSLAGALERIAYQYGVVLVPLGGQASCGYLGGQVAPIVKDGQRVLYLGDWDFSGGHIESSARERIEAYADVTLDWHRVALTEQQVVDYDLPVIGKYDGRTKKTRPAVETEALDQRILVPLVRDALDALSPVDVTVAQEQQRAETLALLGGVA